MTKELKISIITACYNAEKTIEQTIQSVIAQTYNNIEYIIVDGASTDQTMSIVNQYQDKIDIIISEPDRGIYNAFNKGIRAANGDIIYFLNSDDILYENTVVDDVIEQFSLQNDIIMLYGDVEYVDSINGKIHFLSRDFNLEVLKNAQMPHHQGTFYNKEIFEKYGLFSEEYKLASDFEFTTRFFEKEFNKIHYFKRNIAKFRDGGISTTIRYGKKSWTDEAYEIINKVYGIEKTKNPLLENMQLFKLWLELSLKKLLITSSLKSTEKIAIFGSGDVSIYLIEELSKQQVKPVVILDNAEFKNGKMLKGITICSPTDIMKYEIDTIILSAEANYDNQIKEQLKMILKSSYDNVEIISWKELVIETYQALYE